ncbi:MAG: hypothetical protein ABRQ24_10320 [Syntrophomonadaceae bacterium]
MKIYYICEYCERVFQEIEVEGGEGSIPVSGICDECAMEMGLTDTSTLSQHYYS